MSKILTEYLFVAEYLYQNYHFSYFRKYSKDNLPIEALRSRTSFELFKLLNRKSRRFRSHIRKVLLGEKKPYVETLINIVSVSVKLSKFEEEFS
jgi:hypothetical protein